MNICIIWKNDYPWDVRIEKFAHCLRDAGHEVFLLCSNSKRQKTEEDINGIKIRRLPAAANPVHNAIISAPFYLNPYWLKLCSGVIEKNKIDLIIVRDLPLVVVSLLLKKKYGIPVVLDMAENYPAMYWKRFHQGGLSAAKNFITKNPFIIEWVERYALKNIDRLIVVVEESATRLISMGLDPGRVTIVSNTPDLKIFTGDGRPRGSKPLQLIYVGFIQEGRGLETVIEGLALLKKDGNTSVKFVVIGDGDYLPQLKSLAAKTGVSEMVEFKGWMKNTEVPRHIFESDIGVIPHKKTDHTDTTIPNKLFDFMACAKPVIVSNAAPMQRVVFEHNCGLVFKSEDPEDFRLAVEKASQEPQRLIDMGRHGLEAVRERYNWEHDARVLKMTVEGLLQKKNA